MLCSLLAIWVFKSTFGVSDYILWVLIVTDPAYHWLHFTPEKKGSTPPWLAEHFWWEVWLSIYLHLHGTVRDMSQVHSRLGWYGSQITSTCPPGPTPPLTSRPLASLWEYLTYPARLLLQLLNKTATLFINTVQGTCHFRVVWDKITYRFLKLKSGTHLYFMVAWKLPSWAVLLRCLVQCTDKPCKKNPKTKKQWGCWNPSGHGHKAQNQDCPGRVNWDVELPYARTELKLDLL